MDAPEEEEESPPLLGTVLVVEDDAMMRGRLSRSFRRRGIRVLEAATVRAARRKLKDIDVELVLLDIRLGDESGVEVARLAVERTPAPAVLAVSGAASPEEAFALARLGVRAYLPKTEVATYLDRLAEVAIEIARIPPPLEPIAKAQVGVRDAKDVDNAVRQAMLEQALGLSAGNHAIAARRLGISRQAVQQRVSRRKK
ncbi:MAG: response regulator [Sandaracinaceae bacterium]